MKPTYKISSFNYKINFVQFTLYRRSDRQTDKCVKSKGPSISSWVVSGYVFYRSQIQQPKCPSQNTTFQASSWVKGGIEGRLLWTLMEINKFNYLPLFRFLRKCIYYFYDKIPLDSALYMLFSLGTILITMDQVKFKKQF